ncbi:CRAL/TRIO domain-containing protein [Saccharata proteae CBS 121410]|uniref:CRAL/TRIO domain-containing protein n=1 Tax=Saccharata proteae CBS 121410 TaxID=1314787 RepID=A0A9P4LYT6_9PEZI|nr:CRAL/TRIO domain-containing protein [Saccharata proteae CBS 121410]
MADANLVRTESFQYPAAHLGHLTDNQQAALDQFKELCAKDGYYKPAGVEGRKYASHDDETLLRYLRARKFTPTEALKQFEETEDWRKENNLEKLYDTIDVEEYDQTRRLYPQWTGRRDKRGIPVYVFEVAHLNSKNIAAYESSAKNSSTATASSKVPPKMLRLFALYENLTRFVMPLCSAVTERHHPETPISQSNNIVDISKVGLKQFWNLKAHMQDASTLATAHYPETLDRIFIIGAPSFFPTVWSWVKRWFDPITVSKIFILSNANMKSTLEQYIDPENIPKKYGGKLDFEFGMMPILEPAIQEHLNFQNPSKQAGANTIPTGPIKWEEDKDGKIQALAVGSENGKHRRTVVANLNGTGQSLRAMHGASVTILTPTDEFGPTITTTGTHTQPEDDPKGAAAFDRDTPPPSDAPTPADSVKTLPVRTAATNTPDESRAGTSETRYEAQHGTHAAGQLASGTPHSAINDHGHGDKTVTMEPGTVGQAPKDVSKPLVAEDTTEPSVVDQAKAAATQAYETATTAAESAAVAVGLKKEEVEKAPEPVKPEDQRVDQMSDQNVEKLLREQHTTRNNM